MACFHDCSVPENINAALTASAWYLHWINHKVETYRGETGILKSSRLGITDGLPDWGVFPLKTNKKKSSLFGQAVLFPYQWTWISVAALAEVYYGILGSWNNSILGSVQTPINIPTSVQH